ncbi:hypothetical protein F2Q68_00033771 [Brassica cretica]|uniref:Uncharacterized protein n=2 Tax=Brassica cretica TaxID=69181 RepID=A0ABQ7E8G0_BRACR|nr:hypothetical protein F2Q68_00033771 [Brassica cretica]KAF3592961.1 hypothetical protein DY000_02021035 [Brassica cretica]
MFVRVHELGELCHFFMIFVMVMSEPRFIWLVDASVAVVGCGSIDRVSDLEMEVHCVSLVLVVFLSGGIVSIGCMSSVSSLVSVPQEISKVCGLSSGSPCRVMKSPVLGLTIGGRGSNDKCGLGAEVEVGWRAMGSSGNSRSLAFLSFKVYQVFCSSPK